MVRAIFGMLFVAVVIVKGVPARSDVDLSFGSAGAVTMPSANQNFDWNVNITIKAEGVKVYIDLRPNKNVVAITWDMAVEDDGNMLGRDFQLTSQTVTTNGHGHWEHLANGNGICQGIHAALSARPPAQQSHTVNPYAEIYQTGNSQSQTTTPSRTYYVNTTP